MLNLSAGDLSRMEDLPNRIDHRGQKRRRGGILGIIFASTILAQPASRGLTTAGYSAGESAASIYVDSSRGTDSNSGTKTHPLRSISKAVQIALQNYSKGFSTAVMIFPGTYREKIGIGLIQDSGLGASITFSSVQPGTVVISGADLWNDWRQDPEDPRIYTHGVASDAGPCPIPDHWPLTMPESVRRREIVIVNGKTMRQESSLDQLQEGSFVVDDAGSRILLMPASGTNMNSAQVEVAVRPKLLEAHHISQLTLDGLSFVYADSCPQEAAVAIYSSSNDVIKNSSFQGNNWIGLQLTDVRDSTVDKTTAVGNGSTGFSAYKLRGVTFQNVTASLNGWRVQMGNFFEWGEGGLKIMLAHDTTFRRIVSYSNQGSGLWFDTDNRDDVVSDSYLSRNSLAGVKMEANQGPLTLERSKVCNNGQNGIFLLNSDLVTLRDNFIAGNGGGQIFVDGRMIARSSRDWESGQPYSAAGHHLTMMGNTIVAADPSQILFKTLQAAVQSSIGFFSTLISDSNTWYNPGNSRVLQYDAGGIGHAPRDLSLAEWQATLHQDKNSTQSSPGNDFIQVCSNP